MMAIFLAVVLSATFAEADLPFDPVVDPALEKLKPRPTDTLDQAKVKCETLAAEGERRGVRTLLVGIEGQGGFKADNAWLVYRYLWRITHSISDSPPVLDTAAPVLNRLLLPLIDYFRGFVEVLDFPETAVTERNGGVPEACVAAWMARSSQPRVVMIGHSFGADAVHDLSHLLARRGIQLDVAFSLDAVARGGGGQLRRPMNVGWWGNFLQRNEPPFGAVVVSATENRDLSSHGVNHRTIVRSAPVISAVKERLGFP